MNKIMDIFIGLGLSAFILIIWVYEMVVASDIPVEISYKGSVVISCLLVLFLIIYSFYTRKTIYILMNTILLLILLFLWFMSMQQALTYHYHKYDTVVDIIGFSITLILFLQLIYRKVKIKGKT
ncbi:hypothetical protein G9F71_025270 [Clostridium sp. FP2]|uniref:hypothetical protein n=1 Tax=Clostridium TaxID=1485 RepID=UPI0013E90719|nr:MULTISPECIES: hypothetical protein [Clostridium]MBW9159431.1 hypothetical protein [Clostridium tagluense]MBZ9626120.1 hypothetical protein [Clostridium sp. FP2]WLC68298.1 hypothetical protein KTC93_25335 [Clostridium tagluense]